MNSRMTPYLIGLPACLIMIGNAHAIASPDDRFQPYIYAEVVHDSNLFRLPNESAALSVLGTTKMDDTIQHYGAGFNANLPISRQNIHADATVDRSIYDTFSSLDNTGGKGKLAWNWRVGSLWNGDIGSDYSKMLSSFTEQQSVQKDMITRKSTFATAGYQLTPDWRISGGLKGADVNDQIFDQNDRKETTGSLEINYRTTANTRIGIRDTNTDTNLLNDQNVGGTLVNNDYTTNSLSGVIYWEESGKSKFEGSLGQTTVKFDSLDARDFTGATWRLTYMYFATGKTHFDASYWRNTSSQDGEISTYVVSNGISLAPSWAATTKIHVGGLLKHEETDYKGDYSTISTGSDARKDKINTVNIRLGYNLRQNIELSLGYGYQKRTSNYAADEYKYNRLEGRISIAF